MGDHRSWTKVGQTLRRQPGGRRGAGRCRWAGLAQAGAAVAVAVAVAVCSAQHMGSDVT